MNAESEQVVCPRCGEHVLAYWISAPPGTTDDVHAHGIWTGSYFEYRDVS